jgi:membrane protein implicated in regulation of membrane protease activity
MRADIRGYIFRRVQRVARFVGGGIVLAIAAVVLKFGLYCAPLPIALASIAVFVVVFVPVCALAVRFVRKGLKGNVSEPTKARTAVRKLLGEQIKLLPAKGGKHLEAHLEFQRAALVAYTVGTVGSGGGGYR